MRSARFSTGPRSQRRKAPARRRSRAAGPVELWDARLKVAEGLELHLDPRHFNADVQHLLVRAGGAASRLRPERRRAATPRRELNRPTSSHKLRKQ